MEWNYPVIQKMLQQCWPHYQIDKELLHQSSSTKTLNTGDLYPDKPQTGNYIALVTKGVFRLFYPVDNREITIHFLFENDMLLDFNRYLISETHHFHLQALERAEIVCVNLDILFADSPVSVVQSGLDRYITSTIVKITTEHINTNLYLGGEARYSKLLATKPHYFTRIPLYHIASYLGMEKESLSRIRRNIIEKHKRKKVAELES